MCFVVLLNAKFSPQCMWCTRPVHMDSYTKQPACQTQWTQTFIMKLIRATGTKKKKIMKCGADNRTNKLYARLCTWIGCSCCSWCLHSILFSIAQGTRHTQIYRCGRTYKEADMNVRVYLCTLCCSCGTIAVYVSECETGWYFHFNIFIDRPRGMVVAKGHNDIGALDA